MLYLTDYELQCVHRLTVGELRGRLWVEPHRVFQYQVACIPDEVLLDSIR